MAGISTNKTQTIFADGAAPLQRIDASPEAFGSGVGRGLQAVGGALDQAGNMLAQHAVVLQGIENETRAKDADAEFTRKLTDLQYNPQTGFLTKAGKAAVDGLPEMVKTVDALRVETEATLPNKESRRMFSNVARTRVNSAVEGMSRHTAAENKRWQVGASEARATTELQAAALDYVNPQRFQQALNTARTEAVAQGEIQGWDNSQIAVRAQQYADIAWTNRLDAWRLRDPIGAYEALQKNQDQISPTVRTTLETQLFSHAAPALAQQLIATGGPGVIGPQIVSPAIRDPGKPGGPPGAITKPEMAEILPRGLRNNNPGNIVRTDRQWQGEIQGSDSRYASFDNPEAGIRAIGKTLTTYATKYGLNTVSAIIGRWAPATENNTDAYVATVAKALQVGPNDAIDVTQPKIMQGLTRAIIDVENGRKGAELISNAQIKAGLEGAAADVPKTTPAAPAPGTMGTRDAYRDPSIPTGNEIIDGLPTDRKMHVLQLARTMSRTDQSELREALSARVRDASAAYLTSGNAPNPPALNDFIGAWGQAEGMQRWADFQDTAKLGQNVQQVKNLPARDLTALRETAKPVQGDGFAVRQKNYETLVSAIDRVETQRREDPIQYAMSVKGYGLAPITDLSSPEKIAAELAKRAGVARTIAQDYGTAPVVLSVPETKAFAQVLRQAPIQAQKQYLAAVYQGIGEVPLFKGAMQAIAPDAPVLAVAGMYQANKRQTFVDERGFFARNFGGAATQQVDVTDLILRGQAILYPPSKEDGSAHMGGRSLVKMPPDKEMLDQWTSTTGDAFRGKEQAADLFMQTARAIYAAKTAEAGQYDGILDPTRWKQSVQLATGGIQDHRGSKIVLPYGMPYDTFRNELATRVTQIMTRQEPLAAKREDLLDLPLENVGDGKYLFKRGTGYVVTKDGIPVMADFNDKQPPPAPPAGPYEPDVPTSKVTPQEVTFNRRGAITSRQQK